MKICTALLATTLLASAPAMAAEDGGFYVGAGIGTFSVDSDEATSFKVLAGFDFNKYFAAELEYIDSSNFEETEGDFAIEASVTAFNVSVVGKVPVGEKFSLFAKFGMVFYDIDAKITEFGFTESASLSEEDVSYGVGAGFAFTENFGARIEYQGFDIQDTDTDLISASVTWRF